MIRFILTMIFISLLMPGHSQQNYVWSIPVSLSDSLTDNTDATIRYIGFYAGESHYVFWVKSEDTNSSDIVTRRYYTVEEPVPVVFEGEYHYRNPQVLRIESWPWSDTSFVLFYEADLDGDFDIYYRKYTENGFTDPVALTETSGDEKNLNVSPAAGITWEMDSCIYYTYMNGVVSSGAIYPDTIVMVDSFQCSNPSISKELWEPMRITWAKISDDTSKVFMSSWDFPSQGWGEPEVISQKGWNSIPRFSESSFSAVPPTICWNEFDDDSTRIVAYDPEYGQDYFIPMFTQPAPFNPHFFNIFIGVEWVWDYTVITFEKEEGLNRDIYGNTAWLSNQLQDYVNITNTPEDERNPYLFEGLMYWDNYMDVINIWESFQNGHWQLFTSKIRVLITGGVGENRFQHLLHLVASPNPVSKQTKLSFDLPETSQVDITLYDLTGNKKKDILHQRLPAGAQEVIFNPAADLAPGTYIVVINAGKKQAAIKLIVL